MRYVSLPSAALAAVAILFPLQSFGQGATGLSITNYQFVNEERYSRTQSYVTYKADLVNTGQARGALTATVKSLVPSIQTVAGQTNLHFPAVPANGQVTSTDTFTILVDRTVTFSFSGLSWSFLVPIANAGPNQTVAIGSTVTVNGSGSSNPSGVGTLTYAWAFVSKPQGSNAQLTGANNVTATFVADVGGNYVLSLTVSNGSGSDTANVTISTSNSPPVANAGPNQTVGVGATVTLNGSGSSDVDGNPLTYKWTLISRPAGSAATLTNPSSVSPAFVADKAGTYVAQLIVNDGQVDSAPSTVQITTGNTAPVANAGPNQMVTVGATVQLNGSGSTDVDGDPLTYHWTFNSKPAGSNAALSSVSAVNPTFVADVQGSYVIQLVVNDGKVDSAPSMVTITTNTVQAPTANAGANQTVKHGTTVTLSGSGTDPQGLSLTFQWSLTMKPAGSSAALSSTSTQMTTFVADLPGTYVAQLIVNNGVLNSAPSTVTITTTNTAPVANAGPAQSVQAGSTVTLNGSGSSDADGDPLTYSWSLTTKPDNSTAALSGATSVSPTFVADLQGTYVAQLIVNDGFANSAPATVTITVGLSTIALTPNPLNIAAGATGTLTVTLGTPAASNLTVTLASDNTGVATIPANITIGQGATSGTATVTATGAGSATITATATGFAPATATVNVAPPALSITTSSLPAGTVAAQYGATVAATGGTLPYTWSATGLPGGLGINATSGLISGTPTTAGAFTVSITVTDSTNPTHLTNTVSLQLTINPAVPASIAAAGGGGQSAQIGAQFANPLQAVVKDAAGNPIAGAIVTFTAPASGASLTFAGGAITVNATTNGSGVATSPAITANGSAGSYNITASLGSLTPATFALQNTAVSAGVITVTGTTVGQDLQAGVTITLPGAAGPGGVVVTLSSGDASKVLVGGTGKPSADVTVAEGQTQASVFVQGVATGSATLSASSSGFTTGSSTVNVTPSGFVLAGPNDVGASFSTFANVSTTMTVFSARLDSSGKFVEKQSLRASLAAPISVNVTSTSAGSVSPGSVTFNPGDASGTTTFKALNTGSATITAVAPSGFTTPTDGSNTVTANIGASGMTAPNVTVGQNLETTASIQLSGVVGSSGASLTITSSDPSKVKFSATPDGAGSGTLTLDLPPNAHGTPDFYVQGFDKTGSVTYTAQANGFGTATGTVTLVPSGIVFTNSFGGPPNPILAAAGGSAVPVTVFSAILDGAGNWVATMPIAGGTQATVTITNTGNASVGTVNPAQVTIAGGSTSATTQFQPGSQGTTTLAVSVPAGFSAPSATYGTLPVSVTTTKVVLTLDQVPIGQNLQMQGSILLSQAAPSNLNVTLTSNDPTKILLAAGPTDAGAASIQIPISAGATQATYYVQALGNSGSVTYKGSAPGYADGTATIPLTPSAVVLGSSINLPFVSVAAGSTTQVTVSLAQLNPADNTYNATQQLRGGMSLSIPVNTGNSGTATIDSPVAIPGGTDSVQTTLHGIAKGSTTITAVQPAGFVAATNTPSSGKPTSAIPVTVN